jgi:glycosyltransferase involved in cell wall biosynthesis
MNIGIVSLGAISKDTGGKNYVINFAKAVKKINLLGFIGHQITFYMSKGERFVLEPYLDASMHVVEIPFTSKTSFHKVFGEQVMMPFYEIASPCDVFYFPGNFVTLLAAKPTVVAIRSMLYYHYPEAIDGLRRMIRRTLTPPSAKLSRRIIAPSEDIKNDIVNFVKIPREKISVIHHGVDTEMFQTNYDDGEKQKIFEKFGIRKKFIAYVSALWRYKNQDKLISALNTLTEKFGLDYQLVIVGKGLNMLGGYEAELYALVKKLQLEDRVVFTGQLSHQELKYFYKYAEVFVYPSSIESFGNPLFEAWAAGVPVVCSNVHAFPEMTLDGTCALMVNPLDPEAIAEAVAKIATDERFRNNIVVRGHERIKNFSWEKCVKETLAVLEAAAKNK